MDITPLEKWIARKIGCGDKQLSSRILQEYQLEKLRETLNWVKGKSSFYKKHLQHIGPETLSSIDRIGQLPFTTADQLKENPFAFLCVHPDEINRIITLSSSGTTGKRKRIFFTQDDQELTVDFFRHGMSTLVQADHRVLILMPGNHPGSIGDLLKKGLSRLGVESILYGPVQDVADVIQVALDTQVDTLVGIPTQVLAMAGYLTEKGAKPPLSIKNVLLSADYVPRSIYRWLYEAWGCHVFNHYGMTEMGLGGGVECQALDGYHLREADLYFEIVDPLTGLPVDEGKPGEVVFSTLTRRGMPLLRYRTGDVSRFIPHPCCCGTVLKRMERIAGRVQGGVLLDNHYLTMTDFDEVLFTMDFVLDFKVILTGAGGENCLQVHLKTKEGSQSMMRIKVEKLLNTIPVVKQSRSRGHLALEIYFADYGWTVSNGMSKRMIIDLRGGA